MTVKKSILFISVLFMLLVTLPSVIASDVSIDSNDVIDDAIKYDDTGVIDDIDETTYADDTKSVYVNLTGDDKNKGTSDSPFATVKYGVNVIYSDDTADSGIVYIGEGRFNTSTNGSDTYSGITIAKDTTIIGQGINKTYIDGEGLGRLFNVRDGVSLTLMDLTLLNGNRNGSAGAILNYGNLNINNVAFINNTASGSAGAIYTNGTLNIQNSDFINNLASGIGGAIYSVGTVNISDSAFTLNNANYGGAIYTTGNLNISNSNFNRNSAKESGGAIYSSKDSLIVDSIFDSNTATKLGGAIYNTRELSINGSSFLNNKATDGGAIFSGNNSKLFIDDSIFTNNIVSDQGGAIYGLGDLTGTNVNLNNNSANYGGAVYIMYGLSFENSSFVNNKANDGGAIYSYNSDLLIEDSNFNGNSAIDDGGAIYNYVNETGKTFYVINSGFVSNSGKRGSTIYTRNELVLDNVLITNSTSVNGTIYNVDGNLYIMDSSLTNNLADKYGGGIFSSNSNVSITNTVFSDNTALEEGGALILVNSNSTITGSSFTNNHADFGGAIYVQNSDLEVNQSTFEFNNINTAGGAIYAYSGNVSANYNAFINSTVYIYGNTSFNLNYNWWGFNEDPYNKMVANNRTVNRIVDNWVIMNVTSSKDPINVGDTVNLTASLNTYISTNGTIGNLSENIPERYVSFNANSGSFSPAYGKISNVFASTYSASKVITTVYATIDGQIIAIPVGGAKVDTILKSYHTNLYKGNYYEVVLTDFNGKPLENKTIVFTVNNMDYTRTTNESGEARLKINLKEGNYTIDTSFAGDDVYNFVNLQDTISVKLYTVNSTLVANNLTMIYKDGSKFTAVLTSNGQALANKQVAMTVNGITYYKITDGDGVASLNINLLEGTYEIKCSFSEYYYLPSYSTGFVTVMSNNSTSKESSVLVSSDLTMSRGDGSKSTVNLTDKNGTPLVNKSVILHINGEDYYRTTNASGQASLNINLASGLYTFGAGFLGDDEYAASSASSFITIKNPADLRKLSGLNVISTTVKQGNQLKVELFDENREAIFNNQVTFTINNYRYHRMSLEDGVAALNINLNPGVHKVLVTYDGSADYTPAASLVFDLTVVA